MTQEPTRDIIIAEIEKSPRDTIRVALSAFEGSPTLSIWRWYRAPSGELRPGKGGLVVGLRHLPALTAALGQALTMAKQEGRLPVS